MRLLASHLLHSASDLANFLDCERLTALDRLAMLHPEAAPARAEDSDEVRLVQAHGFAHEERYLAHLRQSGRQVTDLKAGPGNLEEAVAATLEAMRRGDAVIYQAALRQGDFAGYADFLLRVPGASGLGDWHYEVADTKLARSARPKFMIQLCFYADLLAAAQGRLPERLHLVFGDGAERSFATADYHAYFSTLRARYLAFIQSEAPAPYPDPVSRCDLCHWREACGAQRLADDHLSQVANISRSQTRKLEAAGILTLAALAGLPEDARIAELHPDTLARLRQQARLQRHKRESGEDRYEWLPVEPGRGFARLPPPDPGDLFFDMEGDPYEEGGLEYLFGVGYLDAGAFRFRDFWAHSRAEERRAFEAFVDFAMRRLREHPGAHIYHYAAYEETALKRLMSLHGSREAEVDHLLREGRLVDLYKVVREGLRVSETRYSIKNLETFYADKREGEVKSAGASIVWYERWKETGEARLLDDIRAYNADDCRSTWQLRDWLLALRPAGLDWPGDEAPAEDAAPAAGKPWDVELAAYRESLLGGLPEDPADWGDDARARELAYQLLDFYRREAKPQWWAIYARREKDAEELLEDIECLGGLTLDPAQPPRRDKQSLIYTYHYPEQETKLKSDDAVTNATTGEKLGELILDEDHRLAILRVAAKRPQPETLALGPGSPYSTVDQQAALRRFADSLLAGGSRYPALECVLRRRLPNVTGRIAGTPLVSAAATLPEILDVAARLDHSPLFIQGPPGAGKTWTGSRVIVDLLRRGRRVAVSSNSHKAIHNLLTAVEKVAREQGFAFRGVKKSSRGKEETCFDGQFIRNEDSADDIAPDDQLVAGTAWLFSKAEFDQAFDYLFVDEAGQVALANLIALGVCARNLILLGDPMQLGQPTQGIHPGHAGESCLEYLLDGRATVPPEAGIFLPTTWRMAPAVCRFISEAVYDGRLHPEVDNARQKLLLAPDSPLPESGIRFLPVQHAGNSQRSPEEAARVRELYDHLLKQHFIDRRGERHRLCYDDILVVAPYNLQVNLLRQTLPEGARVGTVDKFQGQEAAVVIVSLATSSGETLPRDIGFLFSKNRLNVAISRAQCLALVVASSDLLTVKCATVEQMVLVNLLCRVAGEASP